MRRCTSKLMRLARAKESRLHRRRAAQVALALAFMLARGSAARAQRSKPAEYRVKAVYLYDFARFVQWPGDAQAAKPQSAFPVCVLGRDPFGAELQAEINGGSINGQHLELRHIESPERARGCRILFISASEDDRLRGILSALKSAPLLTVSDMRDFCSRGGMIQFVLQDNRVRFEVNLRATDRAGLTLSSQLLKVAAAVQGGAAKQPEE